MMKRQPKNNFHVAIDGPVAAGKGTIAILLAQRLGFLYVDTGAMYRVATLIAMRQGIDLHDENQIAQAVESAELNMFDKRNLNTGEVETTVELDGDDVSTEIRTRKIDQNVSTVAGLPKVRAVLVKKQQEIAQDKNVVMEGRDIGYRVLPEAQLKIFLTADVDERARRRFEQYRLRGNQEITMEEVKDEIKSRDEFDMSRQTDPLKQVDDAWLIDTTEIDIEAVLQKIIDRIRSEWEIGD